jgi:hypothetical protein
MIKYRAFRRVQLASMPGRYQAMLRDYSDFLEQNGLTSKKFTLQDYLVRLY